MRKILIFGCTKVTEAIVPLLCSDISIANEICIASGDKADCDVLRKKYSDLPVRITTARADVNNEAGTKMMLSIIQPDLIVNLEPAPLSTKVMKIALYQGADYIDASLDEWNKGDFLSKQFSGHDASKNISVEEPAGTITCRDHHAFVSAHYGNGFNTSVDAPAPTLTCKDRLGLVTSNFLEMQYGNGTPASTDEPAPAVTTNPKHNLVSVKPWIMNTNYGNVGSSIDEPSQTITANRKWHYLMNPQFANKGGSIDKPCFTLIARMDKMPPYLVSTKEGLAIEVYETDSPATIQIKEFMALYGIADIRMRMLRIPELKRIMGFPEDYTLIGTQAEQKKFIGNAVEVNMARVLCEALCKKLNQKKQAV